MKNIIKEFIDSKENLSDASKKSYENILIQFFTFIKNTEITSSDEIDDSVIESFLIYLENQNKSSNTIKKYLSVLRTFFNYLRNNGYINRKVGTTVEFITEEKNKKLDVITPEEFNTLANSFDDDEFLDLRDKLIFYLLYYSEIKVNELIELKLQDLTKDQQSIKINNKYISLTQELHHLLNKYLRERQQLNPNNNYLINNYSKDPISRQGVWKLIKKRSKVINNDKDLSPEVLNRSYKLNELLANFRY